MPRPRVIEQRKRQILEAAAQVIVERGVCDTRIADIARRIGTSPGLVLYYFASKDELLGEALAYTDQLFYDEVASREKDDPRLQLRDLIESSCSASPLSGGMEMWALWLDMWTRARHDKQLAKERRSLDRKFRKVLADVVRRGQTSGHFGQVDADSFALTLASLIDGLAIQVVLNDTDVSRKKMRDICVGLASRELNCPI